MSRARTNPPAIPVTPVLVTPDSIHSEGVPESDSSGCNEVVLRGRVAAPVDERELPSGDTIMTARLIVDRDPAALGRSSQKVDTIDCVAWLRRVQRSMRGWRAGDRVEISGSIRRRFFRGIHGPVSRVEVEIRSARRLDRPRRSDGPRKRA